MEKTRIMKVGRAFFDVAPTFTRENILRLINTNELIPLDIINKMTASEGKQYQREIEATNKDRAEIHPNNKINLRNLKSTVVGYAETAALAYAPAGFHK